jgi:hypothetical protein
MSNVSAATATLTLLTSSAPRHICLASTSKVARWRALASDAEHLSINLKAMPSFNTVGRAFQATNPFEVWMRLVEFIWLPWLTAARASMLRWTALPSPRPPGAQGS